MAIFFPHLTRLLDFLWAMNLIFHRALLLIKNSLHSKRSVENGTILTGFIGLTMVSTILKQLA